MSVDKLVDSTQLDTDLTSVANAIRAKSGGSGQLAFPAGFVSEIGNIPSGGGMTLDWANITEVTIGANSVTNTTGVQTYFSGTGMKGTILILKTGLTANNQFVEGFMSENSTLAQPKRYRSSAISGTGVGTTYDCVLVEGSKYYLIKKK